MANERDSYTTEEGGMIPFELSQHHIEVCDKVLSNAFEKAGIKKEDVDLLGEIRRLQKENMRLKEEREILKKAAKFFANEKK